MFRKFFWYSSIHWIFKAHDCSTCLNICYKLASRVNLRFITPFHISWTSQLKILRMFKMYTQHKTIVLKLQIIVTDYALFFTSPFQTINSSLRHQQILSCWRSVVDPISDGCWRHPTAQKVKVSIPSWLQLKYDNFYSFSVRLSKRTFGGQNACKFFLFWPFFLFWGAAPRSRILNISYS